MVKRPRMLNEPRRSRLGVVLTVLCVVLVVALLIDIWFVRRFYVVRVSGGSMENTLFDGDTLYADRVAAPKRGDVVIIDVSKYREEMGFRGDYIIKRIIAIEGDSVMCENQTVYLKKAGETEYRQLEEPYTDFPTRDFEEVVVGEGEIFFLGDHRTNSVDSRTETVGCLKLADVVGVVPSWSITNKKAIAAWEQFRVAFGI